MLTVNELNEIRARVRQQLTVRKNDSSVKLVISSGTTAIAAGSRNLMAAALDEIQKKECSILIEQRELEVSCDEQPAVMLIVGDNETLHKRCTVDKIRELIARYATQPTQVADN